MAHDQLRLDLIDRIHRHANHDQQRRSAKIELHVQTFQQEAQVQVGEHTVDPVADQRQVLQLDAGDHQVGNQAQDRKINAAHHGDPSEDLVHVIGRIAPRPYARTTAVLAHVVGRFVRVEIPGCEWPLGFILAGR